MGELQTNVRLQPLGVLTVQVLAKAPLRLLVSPSMRPTSSYRLVVRVFSSWTVFSTFSGGNLFILRLFVLDKGFELDRESLG